MLTGILVGESVRTGAALEGLELRLYRVAGVEVIDPAPGQPPRWTLLEFGAEEQRAPDLAAALARCLESGPWYASFTAGDEVFVVFADRIFRYARGDRSGRARAAQYARTVGVPEKQLDWTE
jgi:pimeloyl-ACP methyl ester carboxylesterase